MGSTTFLSQLKQPHAINIAFSTMLFSSYEKRSVGLGKCGSTNEEFLSLSKGPVRTLPYQGCPIEEIAGLPGRIPEKIRKEFFAAKNNVLHLCDEEMFRCL